VIYLIKTNTYPKGAEGVSYGGAVFNRVPAFAILIRKTPYQAITYDVTY